MKLFFLVFFSLFLASSVPAQEYLSYVGGASEKEAFVFIGGAVSGHDVLSLYEQEIIDKGVTVYGYRGAVSENVSPMDHDYLLDNSEYFSSSLRDLRNHGFERITVVAACVGALMAMKSIQDTSHIFNSVRFFSISTPLGGFSFADPVRHIPLAPFFSKLLGYAMSRDISPKSDFMKNLDRPFPDNVDAILVNAADDPIVTPTTFDERALYRRLETRFNRFDSFTSKGDHMAALNPETLLDSGNVLLSVLKK